ncbi:TPA: hypothetical protein ON323_004995 [Serratia marcescens]|nr:hypothetical protein [Serratia marcescens]HCR3025852.1 hypothetical protein [Serratia marcescens]
MIFIKTDKGHEKYPHWDDVAKRANFVNKLSNAEHKLSHIFGYYELKEEIHCALTSCNQPHGKGYLVTTESGLETNIGHRCGKKIFGVDFENHANEFDRFRENEERKLIIKSAKKNLEAWEDSLEGLRSGRPPIQWLITCIEYLQNSNHVGRAAAMEFRALSRTQDSNVTIDVAVKDKKYEALLFKFNKHFRESGQALEQESVGKVRNLHVLLTENHLKVLFATAMANIKQVRECDENSVPSPILADISRKANALQTEINKVLDIYNDARNFLTKKNLSPVLSKIQQMDTVTKEDKERFAYFLTNF